MGRQRELINKQKQQTAYKACLQARTKSAGALVVWVVLQKMCGAMDGGAQAPHGCAAGAFFWRTTHTTSADEHQITQMRVQSR
ncbi:hypothetical protein GCM10011362_03390 [Marinobacter halophilus]|uniref:Uncharacterized protein n=1 Tax=Marinobacter halophilus TaxID=1323740 RepID=A0A2T1KCR6_9GAMM|nr:hypothetical protein C7H08_11060 [Marinobacter halophilus]GGC58312.1 hypothetical protein GCM10011362_03390 [Marinobacter halophilus]